MTSRVVLTSLGFGDAHENVDVLRPTAAHNTSRTHTSGTHLEDVSIIIRIRDDTKRIERTTLENPHIDENNLQKGEFA